MRQSKRDPIQLGLVALCIAATLTADSTHPFPQNAKDTAQVTKVRTTPPSPLNPIQRRTGSEDRSGALWPQPSLLAQTISDRGTRKAAKPPTAASATATITLSPATSPSSGQAAVTVITVTGSNFPTDTIQPSQITVSLNPASPGSGVSATATPSAITTIVGTTRRITFQIPSNVVPATPASYLVTIAGTTGAGLAFASGNSSALTILPPARLISLAPASGAQGQSVTAMIGGQYTNFVQGSTQATFGAGITVSAVAVYSPTTLGVTLTIATNATSGGRDVTVATGVQTATLLGGFTVAGPSPTISLSPNTGTQGQQNLSVTITGQNTHFVQGITQISFGGGITVASPLVVNSSTSLTALINIDPAAAGGARTVVVSTNSEVATLSNGFTVRLNQPPVVSAGPNQTIVEYWQLFVSSNAVTSPPNGPEAILRYDGITGSFLSTLTPINGGISYPYKLFVNSSEQLYVSVRGSFIPPTGGIFRYDVATGSLIDKFLPLGANGPNDAPNYAAGPDGNIYVANDAQANVTRYSGSTGALIGVFATLPSSVGTNLTFGPDGNLYALTGAQVQKFDGVTGASLGFFANLSSSGLAFPNSPLFGPDGNLYVSGLDSGNVVRFNGKTGALMDTFVIPYSGGLTRSGASQFGPDGNFYVADVPSGSNLGQILRYNGTTGQFIDAFVPSGSGGLLRADGVQFNRFGAGATLSGTVTDDSLPVGGALTSTWSKISGPGTVTFANASAASTTADFSVPGTYVLRLTASDSQLSASSDVTVVVNGFNASSITSVSPNSGAVGSTTSVVITGQNTHFSQGISHASFGAGVTVASLSVADATHATATLNISSTATPGANTVAVITGSEVATLPLGFTITALPMLSSVTPSNGMQGQQGLSVTVTGQNTHFVQGTSVVSFGAGVTVASLTISSSTVATAILSIDPAATVGARTVALTTGAEIASLANAFTVSVGNRAPVVSAGPNQTKNFQTNELLVVSNAVDYSGIIRYDGPTGTPIGTSAIVRGPALISPGGIAYRSDLGLFLEADGPGSTTSAILRYDPVTGQSTGQFVPLGTGGFGDGGAIILGPDGNLYAIDWDNHNDIKRFDGKTGTYLGEFARVQTGVPGALTFGPDGDLYVADESAGVERFDGKTGAFLGFFATFGQAGLGDGTSPVFGPDGNLYVLGLSSNNVAKFDGTTGAYIGSFVPSGSGGLSRPVGMVFGPDGNLYIGTSPEGQPGKVFRYSGSTGAFIDVFVPANSGGLGVASVLLFRTVGDVITLSGSVSDDGLPAGATVTSVWSKVSGPGAVTFSSPASPVTTATFSAPGVYVLRLTASDTQLTSSSDVTITISLFNQAPAVDAGSGLSVTIPALASLSGLVLDDARPVGAPLTTAWTKFSGPGSVTFANPNSASTTAGFDEPGIYVLRLSASDGQYLTSSDVTVTVTGGVPATITSILPSSAQQGQQNVSVSILGQNSHFVQGVTGVNFGSGITVTSLTIVSSTVATAVLTIDPNATIGKRDVTVSTGSEVATLSQGFTVASPTLLPTITSVSPNSGPQGQGGPVAIVGQNTHFVQGTTQVDFGTGITVSNVTVGCPTCLTVQLALAPTAPAGPHTVTVTTGTEVVSLVGGFTVIPGTPILLTINPAGALQGQTVPVAVTGQYTHFTQGTTQVSFSGTGVTAPSVSVTSSTSLTAQVQVAANAAISTRDFTVTTGTEVVTVSAVFKIVAGVPTLTLLTPGSGQQGQTLPVAITGQFTHFVQGTTQVSFGAGITTNSVTVTDATDLTAQITIAPNATVGTQSLTVTTGTEVLTAPNAFAIQPATIIIFSLDPGGSYQGQTLSVSIVGQGTHFVQGTTTANFGAGIAVGGAAEGASGPVSVTSPTTATANITIDLAAVSGLRTVTATTGTEQASFVNGFTVLPLPSISSMVPNSGVAGQQNISMAIVGQNTHFAQGTTQVTFSSDVTAASVTVTDATHLTAIVNISSTAVPGTRQVQVTSSPEVAVLNNGFTILPTPTLTSIAPNTGLQGTQNLSLAITGSNTHFVQGTTQITLGAGITVVGLTVSSATSLTAQINIDPAATAGSRTLNVATGTETESLSNAFTVTLPASLISSNPATGQQGQQNLSITLTGQNTHFAQGTTQVTFGSGVTVYSVTVTSPTVLIAQISLDPNAATGARAVTVITGAENVSLASGFTVTATTPALLTVTPGSALQAQTMTVTVIGVGTHFVQGVTQARFGPGISVGGATAGVLGPVAVNSPTSATVQLSVLNSALPGSRPVTLQTGSELDTVASGFVVNGIPSISSVAAGAAQQGQSGTVTVTGAYTHFTPGTTTLSFGAGITVGSVTVTSSTSLTAQITVSSTAVPGLRIVTAQTGTEQASASNLFTVLGPVIGPGPGVVITSPTATANITTLTQVTGTVTSSNLAQWILDYQSTGGLGWTTLATGTTAAVAGAFDPTLTLNGNATIRLTGIDTSGQSSATTVMVVITRNLKIGNFTVSFNDLSVPVAGLPIQIVRTYDSRNQQAGDFGVGWTLGLNSVTIATNGSLGDNWTLASSGGAFPTYCVQETTPHLVTLSFVDGTTYQFTPVLTGACQQFVPPSQVTMSFVPKTSTGTTPPNAGLALVSVFPLTLSQSAVGPVQFYNQDAEIFDPDQFKPTLPDGRTMLVSQQFGLQSFTDLNGNKLTITSIGITHSSGKTVTFTRDGLNRISKITDPNGNSLNYTYNTAGDLVAYTDTANNQSTYTYNATHGLLTIVDPAGVQPIRNDYDASGRLVSHTDAYGNVINYTNNPALSQEVVTDRLGNVTINQYDSNGNIVQVTDALGGVTARSYDTNGNVLTETNALNETRAYTYDANNNKLTDTDPLLNKTTYTYNARNQVLTIADALGRVTTNVYDTNGNLLTTQDPLGNTTTSTYNTNGQVASRTDANGGVTAYLYDASGNLTKQTDALGNVTTYSYDNNGNKTQQSQSRTTSSGTVTMLTAYQYDGLNRLTETTYADASTTQTQYNSIGKQGATIDQLGRQTSYQYDLMGRMLQTTYPDATTETSAYDANGNRESSSDRAGRTTVYLYDPLNRLTKTTYPDSSFTSTVYDAIGEVASSIDALGHTAQYQYDAAGRRSKVTDALGHATTFTYDSVGNQTAMQDANGNTTQYVYDNDNRRSKVIYPDTTTDLTGYDALGRTISKTDQANLTTQYQYDKLGRLLQVTDAASQITSYTYDEVGNRLTQTDANHHTTFFAYDNLGRRTKRTLPLGMSETSSYDAAGNLKTKTDFNGKTTTYAYDLNNRLVTKVPDATFAAPTVNFGYTATGQRQFMVDASGTTNYTYDLRNRLTSKATPQGTLSYTYDKAGNLLSLGSSNTNGTSVNYAYDALNRLSTVVDNRLTAGTTTYSYDNVGNLQNYTYPNGVQTAFVYNSLNRLTNLTIAKGSTLASYAYQLGAVGNRTQVIEMGGRQVNYGYDNLYRLTNETIAGTTAANGSIGYQYDPAGNRLARTSTVAAVPAATSTYDANDRLASDTYDADGNTIASGTNVYIYDFENHLTSQNSSTVTIVYDGDGNRVAKTVGGVTTKYLVDDRNLTGYAQVVEELASGSVQRVYTYGLNRVSQSLASGASFYGDDGHGSVRLLTDTTGAVTDRYDYDAFGNILSQAGTTGNLYLYSGEQNDPNLGFYYLRARYFSPLLGRFESADPLEGDSTDPVSLHRYAFADDNPIDRIDPSGMFGEQIPISGLSSEIALGGFLGNLRGVISKVEEGEPSGSCPATEPHIRIAYGINSRQPADVDLTVGMPERGPEGCHVNVSVSSPPYGSPIFRQYVNLNYHIVHQFGGFFATRQGQVTPDYVGGDTYVATQTALDTSIKFLSIAKQPIILPPNPTLIFPLAFGVALRNLQELTKYGDNTTSQYP